MDEQDRIKEILERYSEQAEEEHQELFWKPPVAEKNIFICCNCGKHKMLRFAMFFYRLDGSTYCFCNRNCFTNYLKKNPKISWKFDKKIYHYLSYPIETAN